MKILESDLLDVQEGIICHQVNCQGVMGSGIAKQIADKWPFAKEDYVTHVNISRFPLLGTYQLSEITNKLMLANIFGQDFYGIGEIQTNYSAIDNAFKCLSQVVGSFTEHPTQVYIPEFMGCGLGGGDWEVYYPIVEKYFPHVIVCRLPPKTSNIKTQERRAV